MSAKEYIVKQLSGLLKDYPVVEFGYKYDFDVETHLISVIPYEVYENDIAFIEREADIVSEFHELYPSESILFVSTESLCWFDDPAISVSNKSYAVPSLPDLAANYSIDLCVDPGCQMYTVPCLGNNYSLAA